MGELVKSGQIPNVALEAVRYDTQTGLVPVVVQDRDTQQVLMQAYANREALKRTLGTGQAWFWSRSRQEYWRKGATSGNVMEVKEVRLDCDGDAVLYVVVPHGPACHTGEVSCFYRAIPNSTKAVASEDVASEDAAPPTASKGTSASSTSSASSAMPASAASVLPTSSVSFTSSTSSVSGASTDTKQGGSGTMDPAILITLWEILESRYRDRPQGSYTTFLFEHGVDKIAKKVGEEAVEVAIAAKNAMGNGGNGPSSANGDATAIAASSAESGREELAAESADLLYHLLALWKLTGLNPDDVFQVLRERHR